MNFTEIYRIKPGSAVWVWVVRLAKGRWWPGTVEELSSSNGRPRVVVCFECRGVRGPEYSPAVTAGKVTTAMRYLERRDVNIKGIDRPRFIPVSLLERPEELDAIGSHPRIFDADRRLVMELEQPAPRPRSQRISVIGKQHD